MKQQSRTAGTDQSAESLQTEKDSEGATVSSHRYLIRDSADSGKSDPDFTTTETHSSSNIRARRSTSKSPSSFNQHFQQGQQQQPPQLPQGETTSLTSSTQPMYQATAAETHNQQSHTNNNNNHGLEEVSATDYTEITYHADASHASTHSRGSGIDESSHSQHSDMYRPSTWSARESHAPVPRRGMVHQRASEDVDSDQDLSHSETHPPLLEIPEEVYAVRKSALQVLKPLTRTWVVVTVGFSLTVLFGMTRWTRLLRIPFWFILLPSWCSHVGLLVCHMLSARALSKFISEANDSRQRPDSRDHLNRTEYLPLLQRSLKFGLKTGVLSFFVFVFEILIYVQLAWGSISLAAVFLPLWLIVTGGILDGIICKTQHFLRVICWILVCVAMTLTVLKVDYGMDVIRWRVVVSPVVALLSIISGTLIYIVYGHQIGYYQLTESQLTAGNLYSLAALICIVLFVVIGEVIPLSRPVEIETRIFIVVMAPLVVCLVGMGAWVVSRDEFGRLLLYGGQAAVHPMKLRWEADGWTSVQSKGVTTIPMFGEVSFRPLERRNPPGPDAHAGGSCSCCSRCKCCTWYPYEDEEAPVEGMEDLHHPYLQPSPPPGLRINDVLRFR